MPSPFPGVDPYLEESRWWHGFHNLLIAQLAHTLNRDLPPAFSAHPAPHGGLVAYPDEVRVMFLEIRAAEDLDRVVTILEVLSPTNKALGEGRNEYLAKQRSLLRSNTHLLEIDLLRGGRYTAAAPEEGLRQCGRWDHLITLHRATQRYHFEYWFNTLREPLPSLPIPLTEEFPDVVLDLQAAYQQAWEAGPYRRRVDYRQAPPVIVSEEDAIWMDALLREKGLRS